MKRFRNLSLQRKQTLVIMLTSGVALLLACLAFTTYEVLAFRRAMISNLSTLAEMVGNSSTAALDFNDPRTAEETLSSLKAGPNIIGAGIYNQAGEIFAEYDRPNDGHQFKAPPLRPPGSEFENGALVLTRSVVRQGEVIGTVYVESDLGALYSRLRQYVLIVLGVFLVASLVAFVLSSRLQRVVSVPILNLVQTARIIAQEKNYSMRALKQSQDELGTLVDAFNEMVSQVEFRDGELRKAKEGLEQRVQERTVQLANTNAALQQENLQRKQAEAALRRTEELYRRAIAGADAVPYAYDYKTRSYQFMGEGIERLTGYAPQEITPALWKQISLESVMGGETAGIEKDEAARRVVSGELRNWQCDMRIITRDGQTRWLSDASVQQLDELGRPTGSMGILQDITERKRAEESLAHQVRLAAISAEDRQKFFALVENSSDFIGIASLEGKPIYLNQAGREMSGLDADADVALMNLSDFYDPETATRLGGEGLPAMLTGGRWAGEGRLRHFKTSQLIDIHIHGFLVRHPESGEPLCLATIQRDVTARKNHESKMESLNKQLLEVSRLAGMSEVASNVLHNVGNVLNSVNVSTALLSEKIKASKVSSVAKAAELLAEHADDLAAFLTTDPRGSRLPAFLGSLGQHLLAEQQALLKEAALLAQNMEHIKDIIAMQQSYAKVSGVTETVSATDLVEDALRMNDGAFTRHEVRVVREFSDVPPITTEKHKVLQILVNLMRNAKYALDEGGRSEKLMRVRVERNGHGTIKISVIDDGVGIPPENLTRIFNHGFTTRKAGHGFGLHSGALAARELGGSLTAHSNGPGLGAVFTLELPASRPEHDL
jgi:PAS domain S-box-containing protein